MNLRLKIQLLLLIPLALSGQEIEIFGGLNKNVFFDYQNDEGRFNSEYKPGQDFFLGIKLSEVNINNFAFDLALAYEKYSGEVYTRTSSFSASNTTQAQVEIDRINISLIPLKFRFRKSDLCIYLGPEVSILIQKNLEGKKISWKRLLSNNSTILDDNTENFTNNIRASMNLGIQDKLHFGKNIYMRLGYEISYGLTTDILAAEANISNFIHRFMLGVGWNLPKT